ncbi:MULTISPECIES: hypothetical protein [Bacillus amyloliquefaciens group]|uniref:hypothetical protein n=1 Tax=Bacillus amyloliquefaciens group TaxID=1938374 RepID=UPI0005EB96E7|nr:MULTISPECIES: hypothetical protein [Bacillus amyloliquefaciens group]KJR67604.1 hypothetical protein BAGR45_18600 [Bacillus velezensis]MEB4595515.1 hypothetical protein [Bacillus amyloliquefaciens]
MPVLEQKGTINLNRLAEETDQFLLSFAEQSLPDQKSIQLFAGFCKYYRKTSHSSAVKEHTERIASAFVDKSCWEDLFHCNTAIVNELIHIYLTAKAYKKKRGMDSDDQVIRHGLQNGYLIKKEWPYYKYAEFTGLLNELGMSTDHEKVRFYKNSMFQPLLHDAWKRTAENELEFVEYCLLHLDQGEHLLHPGLKASIQKWLVFCLGSRKMKQLCNMLFIQSCIDPFFYGCQAALHHINSENPSIHCAPALLPAIEILNLECGTCR